MPTASKPRTGYTHLGGPLLEMGSRTGATGENCGVENVGKPSDERRPSPAPPSLSVIAAMERISIKPEPSVFDVDEGERTFEPVAP
jgi:hypothetical protein